MIKGKMDNIVFQNYHRHSSYTNPRIPDSIVSNADYAKRASELGHGIISTCEHGTQGRYIEGYELAKKYNLKFVFGCEAYWVKDRLEKDRTNCHIYIAARNENGRQAINDILSEANITGFYGQPRIDIELILSLPASDVIVTTACVAFWKYDDIDEIVVRLHKYFKKNFYLEVQYHNTEKQKATNERILKLSDKYGISLIMGCDSHYISNSESTERNDYLLSKGLEYEDESGWYMDYPTGREAYDRFATQCVLDHNRIMEAINNTNIFLEVEEYNNPCFTQDIKMPTLYPDLTQEQRDKIYLDLVYSEWEKEKQNVPRERWAEYEAEIKKEIDIVIKTKHADYFLLDNAIVKKGRELGGVITPSGRGSGVSFYTNKLLGFTDVDRISAKVKMYPERFMSPTRILESKSLADLDLNLANPPIFAEAQKQILGEEHSYPMVAYGTMKPKAAWKMYAKSQNVDFDIANNVSRQIEKYEMALKHANEDDKDEIDVLEFIDSQYHDIYKQSEKYLGVTTDGKIHPCSYLLYQGNIRKEIGLVRFKDHLCCLMDGKWAEEYKFLKNDLLKVSVIELIDKIYKRIDIKQHSIDELLKLCEENPAVWDVYKKGCTMGINQLEQPASKSKAVKYAPKNISELCALVAAIRPGFKSMYKIFESRQNFNYGIKSFDDLIQTPEMPNSFILYQEMSMATLNYAGIPMSECYDIIKNIAKKRVDKVLKYKNKFLTGFTKAIIKNERRTSEEADAISAKVWQIMEDSSSYAFNSAHAYCVALDSLYGAYLKTCYPVQFYEVFLSILSDAKEKDRFNAAKGEAEEYFKIKFLPFRFRQDNRNIVGDEDSKTISSCLSSIKSFGGQVAEDLYELKNNEYKTFADLLFDIKNTSVNTTQLETLIKIDYFGEFGNSVELMRIKSLFDIFKQGEAKQISKEKFSEDYAKLVAQFVDGNKKDGTPSKSYTITNCRSLLIKLEEYIKTLNIPELDYKTKIQNQIDLLGYVDLVTNKEDDRKKLLITDVRPLGSAYSDDIWAYVIYTKSLGTGKIGTLTIKTRVYEANPLKKTNIILVNENDLIKNKKGYWYLNSYNKIA